MKKKNPSQEDDTSNNDLKIKTHKVLAWTHTHKHTHTHTITKPQTK